MGISCPTHNPTGSLCRVGVGLKGLGWGPNEELEVGSGVTLFRIPSTQRRGDSHRRETAQLPMHGHAKKRATRIFFIKYWLTVYIYVCCPTPSTQCRGISHRRLKAPCGAPHRQRHRSPATRRGADRGHIRPAGLRLWHQRRLCVCGLHGGWAQTAFLCVWQGMHLCRAGSRLWAYSTLGDVEPLVQAKQSARKASAPTPFLCGYLRSMQICYLRWQVGTGAGVLVGATLSISCG